MASARDGIVAIKTVAGSAARSTSGCLFQVSVATFSVSRQAAVEISPRRRGALAIIAGYAVAHLKVGPNQARPQFSNAQAGHLIRNFFTI